MANKLIKLQEFLQACIENNSNFTERNDPVYSIYMKFLPDIEHDTLDFYIYISNSPNKKEWDRERYSFTEVDYINVSEEDEELVSLFYEELDSPAYFSKILLSTLKKLDYSNLNLHKKCAFKVEYSNDW